MKLGLSGVLTRYFITSPLTPLILLASLMVGGLALIALPREEEPQISVPMVDIQCRGTQPTYLPETIRLRGAHREGTGFELLVRGRSEAGCRAP